MLFSEDETEGKRNPRGEKERKERRTNEDKRKLAKAAGIYFQI